MSNYNPNQSTRVFSVTPAPSGQNNSKEIWEGFLNEDIDAINVVNERTNKLIGTIGGNVSYKLCRLPKSYIAQAAADSEILGDVFDSGNIPDANPYIRLENGNIARIDYRTNHFNNGIFIYDAYDIETTDSNNGYWIAYKINDDDATLLEKVAQIKMSDHYYFEGWQRTYIPVNEENKCSFVDYPLFISDNNTISVTVMTLTISKSGNTYSLSISETNFNYGGLTFLSLYNQNAPVPVAPGAALWIYREPYYSLQNDYTCIMNGIDEGWIWYGNNSSTTNLYSYQVGFNVLNGQTAFVEPINSLALTTNFNPLGAITSSFFTDWESHPAGILYFVRNDRVADNGNNTNGLSAMFSPRWTNNTLVTFLTQRNAATGTYTCVSTIFGIDISFLSNTNYGFDSENIYLQYQFTNFTTGTICYFSRFKLDSDIKKEYIQIIPITTNSSTPDVYWETNDGFLLTIVDISALSGGFPRSFAQYGSYIYWQNVSEKAYQLQSNNTFPEIVIGNKFFSFDGRLMYNAVQLGIEYDVYNVVE